MGEYMSDDKVLNEFVKKSAQKETLLFHKNEYLFCEHDPADAVFFIRSGKIKLVKTDRLKQHTLLRISHAGDVLSIHSAINNHPHTNSAVAITDVDVDRIPVSEFERMIHQDIRYKIAFMKLLCSRIEFFENKITGTNRKSTGERLANTFISFYKTYGVDGNNFIDLDLPVRDIANLIGTSKEYLHKIINEFIENGLISSESGKFKILDYGKLQQIARIKQPAAS